MNAKSLLAGVVGGVAAFLLGWVIYGMLLGSMMTEWQTKFPGIVRTEEEMMPFIWVMGLSNIIVGLLLAWIFGHMPKAQSLMGGMVPGAIVSVAFSLMANMGQMAMTTMSSWNWIIMDAGVSLVIGAIVGGVVGYFMGMGTKAASA